jgi:hypothetical protein
MATPPPVKYDYADMCVLLGCATPARRALVAAGVFGVIGLAIRQPSAAFDKDGAMRPFKATSNDPTATYCHFLTLPLVAGTAVFFFS